MEGDGGRKGASGWIGLEDGEEEGVWGGEGGEDGREVDEIRLQLVAGTEEFPGRCFLEVRNMLTLVFVSVSLHHLASYISKSVISEFQKHISSSFADCF